MRVYELEDDTSGFSVKSLVAILLAMCALVGCDEMLKSPGEKQAEQKQREAQAQEVRNLKAEIAELKEQKKKEHHYELRSEGLRTFRFDPDTGDTCIQLTTKEDWKKPDTIRQGCDYVDFFATTPDAKLTQSECYIFHIQQSCKDLWQQVKEETAAKTPKFDASAPYQSEKK